MKNIFKSIFKISSPLGLGVVIILASTISAFKYPAAEAIKLGFIPLTDCAPLVAAKELGLFAKYGVNVELSKEASWANIRDKVLNGELDGASLFILNADVGLYRNRRKSRFRNENCHDFK